MRGSVGRRRAQSNELSPEDPRFWRSLEPGARLLVSSGPARRQELEVLARRRIVVTDQSGRLLAEYMLIDVRAADAFCVLAAVVTAAGLSIRIGGPVDDGCAESREDLAERMGWLFEAGDGEPKYARCPAMPQAAGGRAVPFAAALPAPLRGDSAAAGSERALGFLIMEYAALEPCEDPSLLVLEETDTGRVTVLAARPLDPRQFRH